MYHFIADHHPEAIRLSHGILIPGHIRQYLKEFQIDAVRFMYNFLSKGDFCIYNDESGLGKQTAVAVLLNAACSNKKSLIVVQNDERYVNGWEFHFNVLTNASVAVIKDGKGKCYGGITVHKRVGLKIYGKVSKYVYFYNYLFELKGISK